MAVSTPDDFVKLLEKSRLLDAEKLAQARSAAQKADDATALAKALVRQGWLARWQAGQLLAGRAAFFLGKYKLIEPLGSGGMGRVFLAEHTTMGRRVALEIIPRELGQDPVLLKQFLTEARAIAALDHPNIVHPYSVDSEGDRYYLVMEYVEGQDLQRIVEAEGPLPPDRAARYVQQAADGLAHAHGRKMIHRDIKPANLLVNKQDVVKILDMGMARLTGRAKEGISDKDERLPGTVDYLAPEQALQRPDLDHRVDIYSLGCTFYFLLTGQPPFPEGTLHERILKHQNEEPRKIFELRPDTPPELVEICEKMMSKNRDDRFQSADEVSQVLAEWQPAEELFAMAEAEPPEGVPVIQIETESASTSRRPTAKSTALRRAKEAFAGRKRTLLFAGLAGVAALIVLVGLIFFFMRSGDKGGEKAGSEVAAGDAEADGQESAGKEPSQPEKEEDDNEWPEIPDVGNLRDFDPEALFGPEAEDSDKSKKREKPKKPATDKPQPEKPASDKPEPEEPKSDEAGKAKPDAAASEKAPPDKPEPEEVEPEKKEPEKKEPEKPQPGQKEPETPVLEKEEPAKKEPAKEAPEKPKPQDPLRDLPEAVDLPELGLAGSSDQQPPEVFTIGNIHADPDVQWQLYLLGGETAFRRNRAFVLKESEAGGAQASWLVQLETATGSDRTQEDVAKIRRDGDALNFQWAQSAASSANYLRNCILQVRVEGESKYVTLTTPRAVEPIPIDLERGTVSTSLPVKWLPDGGNLRVQITKVEGREGQVVDPPEPAEPRKPIELSFPRTDRHGNTQDRVAFRLSFTARATAMSVKLQLLEPPPTLFRGLKGGVELARNQREIFRDQLDKQLHPKNKEPPRGPEKSHLDAQFDAVEKELWYINFYDEVHDKAQIHFRIFTEVDGRQVVLATTEQT